MRRDIDALLDQLRHRGVRITVARRAIIRLLANERTPLTAGQIHTALAQGGVRVAVTTVYRELDFLLRHNLLRGVQFEEWGRRYELLPDEHRHHLICTQCHTIEDIVLSHDLDGVEANIAATKDFAVSRHALEFYGTCKDCR